MANAGLPLLWFVAIVAMIPLALWLLKRTPLGGGSAQGAMRTVASLALAPNQRLVMVEVGTGEDCRWLVLGVGTHGISTLHDLPPQALPASAAPAAPAFAQLLDGLRRNKGDRGVE